MHSFLLLYASLNVITVRYIPLIASKHVQKKDDSIFRSPLHKVHRMHHAVNLSYRMPWTAQLPFVSSQMIEGGLFAMASRTRSAHGTFCARTVMHIKNIERVCPTDSTLKIRQKRARCEATYTKRKRGWHKDATGGCKEILLLVPR